MDSGSRVSCYVCIGIWNGLYEQEYMRKIEVEVGRELCFDRGVVKDCLERVGCICEISGLHGLYIGIRVIEVSGMSYCLYRISIDSLCDYICDIVSRNI